MSIPEFIGFLISLFAVFFLVIRAIWNAMYSKKNPEEYQRKQKLKEAQYRQLMGSINQDLHNELRKKNIRKHLFDEEDEEEEEEEVLLPQKTASESLSRYQQETFQKPMPAPIMQTRTISRAKSPIPFVEKTEKTGPSRGKHLVSQLKNPQEMIVLKEIIGPCKAQEK